jgi:hypothetical protein
MVYLKHFFRVMIFGLLVCSFFSCGSHKKPLNLPHIKFKTQLFYKDLFDTPPDSIPLKIPFFINKYAPFFEIFGTNVIHAGFPNEKNFGVLLQQFISDYQMRTVYNDIKKQYAQLDDINEQLNDAFRYYAYYFPHKAIPDIYYYHGGFNQSVITTDSIIGIGLDKYLGTNYAYYTRLGLPSYQTAKMRKEYIAVDALRYYIYGLFPFNLEKENVLSYLIYEGRIQYLLDAVFPNMDDTLKFGFSSNQLTWCKKSERSMWQYLIDKKKLFSNDLQEIKRYTTEGPFTTSFPPQSPARAAVWIAYRIVTQYMDKHPKETIEQLMNEKDEQKIVQQAEYNP